MTERLQIIHLGNAYDFVVKDHEKNRTYGTFQGDSKSLQECLNNLVDENEQLKQSNQEAIELIHDGIVEMHDSKRNYAEKLLNKAIELIK